MTEQPTYETALGAASRETITLLGQDLARDVMGSVGFGELAFWPVSYTHLTLPTNREV